MPTYTLAHVDDETLLSELAALIASDRQTTAALLAHIGEVDARELYLPAACTSMHAYCTRVLHLAEDAAFKRIRAARAARRFPQVLEAIADGRMHLSGVVILAPHLTKENVDKVLAEASHRSKVEIEVLVARLAPRPDLPEAITRIGATSGTLPNEPQLAPGPVAGPAPLLGVQAQRLTPTAPERFALQVTVSGATHDKLERARALMRHRNPSGNLAEVIDRALDELLAKLEREKFAATSRPRAARAPAADADPRHIPSNVRRAVHARDAEMCAFVSATGERCTARGFLEFDHRTPQSLGGKPTVDEIRLLCSAHNQYEAERRLGADFMRAKRQEATSARAAVAAARAAAPGSTLDHDVTLALRTMGFGATETRRAMEDTAHVPAASFEERIRAVLVALTPPRGGRCSDGGFDALERRAGVFLAHFAHFARDGVSEPRSLPE